MASIISLYFKIEFRLRFYACRDRKKLYRFYASNRIKIEFVLAHGIRNKTVLFLFSPNITLKIFHLLSNEPIEIYSRVTAVDTLL